MALPKSERRPHTEALFADSIGVTSKTLWNWKKKHDLERLAGDLARAQVKRNLPDIYSALIREAKKGNYQHIKLALEVAEHHTEEVNVNINHKRQAIIAELSEFERRRRAQLFEEGNNSSKAETVARDSQS